MATSVFSLAEAGKILLKILAGVFLNPVLFQKSIELVAGWDTQQRAELITSEAAFAVGLKSDRFERHARRIPAGGQQGRPQIVRDFEGDLHEPVYHAPVTAPPSRSRRTLRARQTSSGTSKYTASTSQPPSPDLDIGPPLFRRQVRRIHIGNRPPVRQRVAVARALVNNPSILLADQPTGNLDSVTGNDIMALFTRLHEQGNTIVLVTHEHDIAVHANRVIHIRDGKVEKDEQVR